MFNNSPLSSRPVTDASVAVAGAVMEDDFNANTILAANADDTPLPLAVAVSSILGRAAAGDIDDLTPAQVRTIIDFAVQSRAAINNIFGADGLADADINLDGHNIIGVLSIVAGLSVINITESTNLTVQQCRGSVITIRGNIAEVTAILPTCAEGLHGKIQVITTTHAVHLDIQATDRGYLDKTLLDAGDKVSNNAPSILDELFYEAVEISTGVFRWKFDSGNGPWVDGGA